MDDFTPKELKHSVRVRLALLTQKLSGNSLKARCARGSMTLSVGAFAAKFVGFGSKVLLTRLLLPQEMGLAVMILSLTQLFDVMTEVGIKQSVVQHRDGAHPTYMNMAWWFQSIRGCALYVVAFIASPWVCSFYFQDSPEVLARYPISELAWLLRVSFLFVLFMALLSPGAHVLEKKFRFARAAIIVQGGFLLGTTTTIVLAFVLQNVWAIAIGFGSIGFFRFVLSFLLCPFFPRLEYDKASFASLCRFARGMVGLPLLTYAAFNIDVLVAGKLVATSALGLYGMARVLALTPRDLFSQIVTPVLLPAIAEKQDDVLALGRGVVRVTQATLIVSLPMLAFCTLHGGSVLALVFGEEYSAVAVPFALFCTHVVLLLQGTILACLFLGIGQPAKHRAFVGFRILVLGVIVYPGTVIFGLTGVASAVALASLAALGVQLVVASRVVGLAIRHYLLAWLPGLLLGLVAFVLLWGIQRLGVGSRYVQLAFGMFLCGAVILVGFFSFQRRYRGRHSDDMLTYT